MVLDRIKEALSSQFGVDIESISESTDVILDLGADSLDITELMMIMEEEYSLLITDSTFNDATTVGELASFIESLIESKGLQK